MRPSNDCLCLLAIALTCLLALCPVSVTSFKLASPDMTPVGIVRRSPGSAIQERSDGPQTPHNFQSIADLNKYLSEVTDYYNLVSRPRKSEPNEKSQIYGGGLKERSLCHPWLPRSWIIDSICGFSFEH
ncbi:hypothetical protein CAPTEDRAFT_203238 [Capitella teleta]|uniref:Uncharacterized protein n=1 Tax=Capitella teleta TaxID=283909 RepID=R7TTE7_CAPTE|nr:hypothetical protein CAPTEDRAFT_203238 [Capitella teleta]|eukprot:ELT96872.1 hypothetical protein CAPTEDRAFT_203238 [Capitella teleta]